MPDPQVLSIGRVRGTLGEAEADHVWCQHTKMLGQRTDVQPPIRPCGYAGSGPMDHQYRVAFALVMIVCDDGSSGDRSADFGIIYGCIHLFLRRHSPALLGRYRFA